MLAESQNLFKNLSELLINTPFCQISSFYSKLIKKCYNKEK